MRRKRAERMDRGQSLTHTSPVSETWLETGCTIAWSGEHGVVGCIRAFVLKSLTDLYPSLRPWTTPVGLSNHQHQQQKLCGDSNRSATSRIPHNATDGMRPHLLTENRQLKGRRIPNLLAIG